MASMVTVEQRAAYGGSPEFACDRSRPRMNNAIDVSSAEPVCFASHWTADAAPSSVGSSQFNDGE